MSLASLIISSTWRTTYFIFTIVSLWMASLLTYYVIYSLYLPPAWHRKQIHFAFKSDCQRSIGDALCSFPVASVNLQEALSGRSTDTDRVLSRGLSYEISIDLDVPNSLSNQGIGMFMVNGELNSAKGKLVGSSERLTSLTYQSNLLETMATIILSAPLLIGLKTQRQMLSVVLFDDYVDDSYHPVATGQFTLYSKHIHIYGAFLNVKAKFAGIRYFMYNWPLTSGLLFITSNFFALAIALIWFRWICGRRQQDNTYPVETMTDFFFVNEKESDSDNDQMFEPYTTSHDQPDNDVMNSRSFQINNSNLVNTVITSHSAPLLLRQRSGSFSHSLCDQALDHGGFARAKSVDNLPSLYQLPINNHKKQKCKIKHKSKSHSCSQDVTGRCKQIRNRFDKQVIKRYVETN